VIAGHMPVRGSDSEFGTVLNAIRAVHPKIPVFVFGQSRILWRQTEELIW